MRARPRATFLTLPRQADVQVEKRLSSPAFSYKDHLVLTDFLARAGYVETVQNTAIKETEPYLEKFDRFEREAKQPSWVFPLRKAGISRFAETGFPTLHDEDWRFTNVSPITKLPFKPVFEGS